MELTAANIEASELVSLLPPKKPRIALAWIEINPRKAWAKKIQSIRKRYGDSTGHEIVQSAFSIKYEA
jgi:hypothetical protein